MKFTATPDGFLALGPEQVRCSIGRGGVKPAADKREGDGATPAGIWKLREVRYRPDRGSAPHTALTCLRIAEDDGWCDAPADPAYNRPVKLPYPASAEHMWLESGVYDIVVPLGFNDDPPTPGAGSAIFLHLAMPGYTPTAGCVALTRADMETLLARAGPGDALDIRL